MQRFSLLHVPRKAHEKRGLPREYHHSRVPRNVNFQEECESHPTQEITTLMILGLQAKHIVAFLRRTQKPSTCVFHSTTRSLPRIRNIPNRYTQQELGVACDQTGQLMLNISWCAPRHDWKCRKLMFWGSNMEIHQAHIRIFSVHYSPPLDAGADCGVGGSGLCWNLQFPLHTFGQRNHVQCGLCFRKLCDQGAG